MNNFFKNLKGPFQKVEPKTENRGKNTRQETEGHSYKACPGQNVKSISFVETLRKYTIKMINIGVLPP
jgi:hypothetical protein